MTQLHRPPRTTRRALAICPLCCNEALIRLRCRFCEGNGYVARVRRNDLKPGRPSPTGEVAEGGRR